MKYFETIVDARTGEETIRPYTPEEVAAVEAAAIAAATGDARKRRNALLAASDWAMLPDTQTDRDAWAVYRQSLRDVPQQVGFPMDILWPTPPV